MPSTEETQLPTASYCSNMKSDSECDHLGITEFQNHNVPKFALVKAETDSKE